MRKIYKKEQENYIIQVINNMPETIKVLDYNYRTNTNVENELIGLLHYWARKDELTKRVKALEEKTPLLVTL